MMKVMRMLNIYMSFKWWFFLLFIPPASLPSIHSHKSHSLSWILNQTLRILSGGELQLKFLWSVFLCWCLLFLSSSSCYKFFHLLCVGCWLTWLGSERERDGRNGANSTQQQQSENAKMITNFLVGSHMFHRENFNTEIVKRWDARTT